MDINDFDYFVDQFEDIRVLRYRIPGFDDLTLQQKTEIYYLSQAALSGRDILWVQNFRFNLLIRKTIEAILNYYSGNRSTEEYRHFVIYSKRVFFSNGIHHHYSNDKIMPRFDKDYLSKLVYGTDPAQLPLEEGQTADYLLKTLSPIIFDPIQFSRKADHGSDKDIIRNSAVNFYENVSQHEVESFYSQKRDEKEDHPVSLGLNSRLIRKNGVIAEEVYRSGGLYGSVIDRIIFWLEKALTASERIEDRRELSILIDYYRTGDLKLWDEFNIAWVRNNAAEVDFNNGFIETYSDPLAIKATWEAIVNYTDREATKRTSVITSNAQWFEDNSPVNSDYKKEKVTGVAAKVINVAMLGGDCYPVSPLGINLPNSNWIRKEIGSKSVSLGNIAEAYDITSQGNGFLEEFAFDSEEVERARKYGPLSGALHTDLHECVGHASGKLAPGTDPNALKNYASALEEARADLFALYFIADTKMQDLGLIPDADAAMAEYDSYMRNGLMTQLVRIELHKNIEEAHMRNRAAICQWVYEKGRGDKVVELQEKNMKTFVKINDYPRLRVLFGELLREIQRIKSEGDYKAGKEIIENYGIKVNARLHSEILERYQKLNLAPYTGFINPNLIPVYNPAGEITDIKAEYANDYLEQMLQYGRSFSFLS